MPLTKFQSQIAKLLARNRSPESHLAGAGALHLAADAPRYTNDLDYFHDAEEAVAKAFEADRQVLLKTGLDLEVTLNQRGFIRAIVSKGKSSATKVEWAHDSAWRFMPPIKNDVVGYQLHPVDLSVNKVLALAGRDEPRDFLDTLYVHEKHLSLGALVWAAVGKDPGYNPHSLLEMLSRKGRFHAEDFSALELTAPLDLERLKTRWLAALADAKKLVARLPSDEAGALYFAPTKKKFVTPSPGEDGLRVHRGRFGGVLPQVGGTLQMSADPVAKRELAQHYEQRPSTDGEDSAPPPHRP